MGYFYLGLFAAAIGSIFVLDYRRSKNWEERIARSLLNAAERRGGRVIAGGLPKIPAVEVRHGPLTIQCWIGGSKFGSTNVAARFIAGTGPRFSVFPRATMGRGPSLEIDGRFDGRFVVKTDQLEEARIVWSEDARKLMYVLCDRASWGEAWVGVIDGSVVSDGETVTFSRTKAFKSPDAYETAFRLVSILAGAPLEVIDAEAETGRRLYSGA